MISIIVAVERGTGAIGRDGDLLHHISADLRRFKVLTMGHPVIMGRRTFESFPKGPLPGRENIVLTRTGSFHHDGTTVVSSLNEAIAIVADRDAFVIGGGEIYRQALPLASVLHLTEIDATTPDADTFFPLPDESQWTETDCSAWLTDEKTALRYRYRTLSRTQHRQAES